MIRSCWQPAKYDARDEIEVSCTPLLAIVDGTDLLASNGNWRDNVFSPFCLDVITCLIHVEIQGQLSITLSVFSTQEARKKRAKSTQEARKKHAKADQVRYHRRQLHVGKGANTFRR